MIDEATKQQASKRLKLIKGQVEGVERMVDQEKYCIDIINQISAVNNALERVSLIVMKRHIESCLADSLQTNQTRQRNRKIDELIDSIYKFVK